MKPEVYFGKKLNESEFILKIEQSISQVEIKDKFFNGDNAELLKLNNVDVRNLNQTIKGRVRCCLVFSFCFELLRRACREDISKL
ncbi:MAG: hypothetical protein K0S24_5120 [Sphingobacterium sp.]|nr:hypothetical protein [Sphingobacterium sp.]